jgi:hypothetical protein
MLGTALVTKHDVARQQVRHHRVVDKRARIHVLLPHPLGPNKKKAERGTAKLRGNIATEFTVKMVSMFTGTR